MGIANLQTSTKIFAHGDPVNEGTVRTRSLQTSTFIGSVLTQGIGGREVLAESGTPGAAAPPARRWLRRTAILLTSDHPPKRKTAPTMSRPSLRITRHDDQDPPEQIVFEVWNPLAGVYEPMHTLDAGLFRLAELVEQVRVMWVQHDPRRESLKEAPDRSENDDSEWAELRVSAQANRVYETRNFDQPDWKKAASRAGAIRTTCDEIGYIPP